MKARCPHHHPWHVECLECAEELIREQMLAKAKAPAGSRAILGVLGISGYPPVKGIMGPPMVYGLAEA